MKYIITLFIILCVGSLYSQEYEKATNKVLYKGAFVIKSPESTPTKLDILVENGVIKEISPKIKNKDIVRIVELDSQYIYPGFILPSYILYEKNNRDIDYDKINYWNPDTELIGINPHISGLSKMKQLNLDLTSLYKKGFTIAQIFPYSGYIPGHSSILLTDKNLSESEQLLKEHGKIHVRFDLRSPAYPATKIGKYAKFDEILQNSQSSRELKNVEWYKRPQLPKEYEVFATGDESSQIYVQARDLNSLHQLKDLEDEHKVEFIPMEYDHYEVPNQEFPEFNYLLLKIGKQQEIDSAKFYKNHPFLDSITVGKMWARLKDQDSTHYTSPYEKAHISYSTFSNSDFNIFDFIQKSIDYGVPLDKIISSLTTTPAELLGIDEFAGRIKTGYMANFTILNNPMDSSEFKISGVIIRGEYENLKKKEKKNKKRNKKNLSKKLKGDYEIIISGNGEEFKGSMHINDDNSGTLSIPTLGLSTEFDGIEFDKNSISLSIEGVSMGQVFSGNFNGVQDDKGNISGTVETESGTFNFTATKIPENE